MDTALTAFDIIKSEKQADGTLKVWGKATGPDLDGDLQIADPEWLAKAMPDWMQWGNVREQHTSKAAGVATELAQDGDDWLLETLVVDPVSVTKVETGVLKGYSVGIRAPRIVKDAAAPGGRIVGGQIVEVSLVDRPCNPTCTVTIAKAAPSGELVKVDDLAGDASVAGDGTEPGEEAAERDLLAVARQALAEWLASEAAEVAAGTGGVTVVRIISGLLQDLDWAAECDAYDDVAAAIKTVQATLTKRAPQEDDMLTLTAMADLVKAASTDTATEIDKVAVTELRKALGIDSHDSEIADALTKATKALEELQKLGPQVAEVRKANETLAAAGPVRVRTEQDATRAAARETFLAKALEYDRLAANALDPELAAGYRQLAAEQRTAADPA